MFTNCPGTAPDSCAERARVYSQPSGLAERCRCFQLLYLNPKRKEGTSKAQSLGIKAPLAEDNAEHRRGTFGDMSRQKANAPAKSLNTAHIFSVYSLGPPLNLICWHSYFFFLPSPWENLINLGNHQKEMQLQHLESTVKLLPSNIN